MLRKMSQLGLCFFLGLQVQAKISDFAASSAAKFSIQDHYKSLRELKKSLPQEMMQSQVIVAYDLTGSNRQTGAGSFGNRNLHHQFSDQRHNPYETVSAILGGVLNLMDDDGRFEVLAFGDKKSVSSRDGVTHIYDEKGEDPCGIEELLKAYRTYTSKAQLWGPTSFAGPINFAANQARNKRKHTVLVIMTDGAIDVGKCEEDTLQAVVDASSTPLSIIIIGVGDGTVYDESGRSDDVGKFPQLEILDDLLDPAINTREPYKRYAQKLNFDNVQFVNATQFFQQHESESDRTKISRNFTLRCLQEVVDQRQEMVDAKLINK